MGKGTENRRVYTRKSALVTLKYVSIEVVVLS